MTALSELRKQVAARYASLDLPSWPDPHPDMAAPADEEYSRLTEPQRYRIVHDRARVWAEVLVESVGAATESVPRDVLERPDDVEFDDGVRLTCPRPGTLALLLLERTVRSGSEAPLPALYISVERPDVMLTSQPDCGCDACDTGSADLLQAVDQTVEEVVGGPFMALRGSDWSVRWSPGRGSGYGEMPGCESFEESLRLCRRLADGDQMPLPEGTEVLVGRSWLD